MDTSVPLQYGISFYGADYPVDGLVKRLENDSIQIPRLGTIFEGDNENIVGFQREFVWNPPQQHRFIESLLMGLPIPGIFFGENSRRLSFGFGRTTKIALIIGIFD